MTGQRNVLDLPAVPSVRQLIRLHTLAGCGDPDELARVVLAELGYDRTRLRAALAEVLPRFAVWAHSEDRTKLHLPPPREPEPAPPTPGRGSRPSANVAAVHDWFRQFLLTQLAVEGGYQAMGDCTAADLLFAAGQRRRAADGFLVRAAEFERLADALDRYQVGTVAELAAEVVVDVLERDR